MYIVKIFTVVLRNKKQKRYPKQVCKMYNKKSSRNEPKHFLYRSSKSNYKRDEKNHHIYSVTSLVDAKRDLICRFNKYGRALIVWGSCDGMA